MPSPAWPRPSEATEHAMELLEGCDGDWQRVVEVLPLYVPDWGEHYVKRMIWLLTPHGEA